MSSNTIIHESPPQPMRTPRTRRSPKPAIPTGQQTPDHSPQPIYAITQDSVVKAKQREKIGDTEIKRQGYKPISYFEEIMLQPTISKPVTQRNKLS